MCSTVHIINKFNSNKAGSVTQNVTKLSFASVRMCDCKRLSADNFVNFRRRQPPAARGVATSITVTMSAVQSHTPNVTPTRCRTDAVHRRWGGSLCGRRPRLLWNAPYGSPRSFSLTGTIFQSILCHFARIQSSRSQYFTSTNHLLCGFISTFY